MIHLESNYKETGGKSIFQSSPVANSDGSLYTSEDKTWQKIHQRVCLWTAKRRGGTMGFDAPRSTPPPAAIPHVWTAGQVPHVEDPPGEPTFVWASQRWCVLLSACYSFRGGAENRKYSTIAHRDKALRLWNVCFWGLPWPCWNIKRQSRRSFSCAFSDMGFSSAIQPPNWNVICSNFYF